ncbi:MAG: site-specific integrase, partial [Actinobacteria bacterium]|nr:site-specific integrase [Actinomycetota bacterium]
MGDRAVARSRRHCEASTCGSLWSATAKAADVREVGMDELAWEQLQPWLDGRVHHPVGPLFCVVNGPTRGRHWSSAAARAELRRTAAAAGVRRRFAPHQLRHAHAVEMAREGVPLIVIQRQLGHSNLGITSIYLQGIDNAEIIDTVHARRAPMISLTRLYGSEAGSRAPLFARSDSVTQGQTTGLSTPPPPAFGAAN